MIVGHIGGAGAPHEIQKSLRFRASASAYLSRTPTVAGNLKTWTWSGWVKRGSLGVYQSLFTAYNGSSDNDGIAFTAADKIELYSAGAVTTYRLTTAVYRDPSSWYHIVVASDTPNATAQNRARIWVNGSEITAFDTNATITQNADWFYNSTNAHNIGRFTAGGYFDGYLSEINFIDGQALDPSYFGQVSAETGAWIPKKYTGTYGTNGFYLSFNDGSTLANLTADHHGNGNNWTANNISLTSGSSYDWMDDTPTNNFAVLNPLDRYQTDNTFSNGNMRVVTGTTGFGYVVSTIGAQTGKFYFEVVPTLTAGIESYIGVQDTNPADLRSLYYDSTGVVREYTTVKASSLPTYTTGDVIGVAFDATSNSVSFYKNGTLVGTYSFTSPPSVWATHLSDGRTSGGNTYDINFGQRPFAYAPPAGFKALCTKNLPTPSILNPKKHFDVRIRAGNGATQVQTGMLFQPSFKWTKNRQSAYNNVLTDGVRGANQFLYSNTTGVEATASGNVFDATGYTLGPSAEVNANGEAYVDRLWKAGGAPVANNAGSIQSQVSANTQAGFSIVTYTGTGANATVGHGLGVAPKMVIIKSRGPTARSWGVYHSSVGNTGALFLDSTSATNVASFHWNDTSPTSNVFSLGNGSVTNSAEEIVAYCFAEIPGFSKIGSYTGNGSADGPFVYCGFRPGFVLLKCSSVGGVGYSWFIEDAAREPNNALTAALWADSNSAESVGSYQLDFTSNGFKLRNAGNGENESGQSYIFYAVAEQPFQFANAR